MARSERVQRVAETMMIAGRKADNLDPILWQYMSEKVKERWIKTAESAIAASDATLYLVITKDDTDADCVTGNCMGILKAVALYCPVCGCSVTTEDWENHHQAKLLDRLRADATREVTDDAVTAARLVYASRLGSMVSSIDHAAMKKAIEIALKTMRGGASDHA